MNSEEIRESILKVLRKDKNSKNKIRISRICRGEEYGAFDLVFEGELQSYELKTSGEYPNMEIAINHVTLKNCKHYHRYYDVQIFHPVEFEDIEILTLKPEIYDTITIGDQSCKFMYSRDNEEKGYEIERIPCKDSITPPSFVHRFLNRLKGM